MEISQTCGKTIPISLGEFYERTDYLQIIGKRNLYSKDLDPEWPLRYYCLTSRHFSILEYSVRTNFFTSKYEIYLRCIYVAKRDGKTEYDLFEKRLHELEDEEKKHRLGTKIRKEYSSEIRRMKIAKTRFLIDFKEDCVQRKPFDSYLSNLKYKTQINDLKNKYLVFDVETNGIRRA